MSKKTKIWLIMAFSLIFIGAVIFTGVMTMLKWDFTKLSTVKYETNNHEINDSFNDISINSKTADIEFILSDEEKCRVVCYEEKNLSHTVAVQDNTLIIEVVDAKKWYEHIGINLGTSKITVYVPQGEYGALSIKSSTGDIEIPKEFTFDSIDISASTGDVNCNASTVSNMKIKLSTGNINIQDITAGSINFTTSTGGINMKSVDCSGKIETKVSTGKTNLTDVKCESLISTGNTGDIKLTNVIAAKDFNIKRSTGDIRFVACDAGEILITTDTGDVSGTLLTDKVFICRADTGDIDVPKTADGGKCEITTDTGDIEIKVGK